MKMNSTLLFLCIVTMKLVAACNEKHEAIDWTDVIIREHVENYKKRMRASESLTDEEVYKMQVDCWVDLKDEITWLGKAKDCANTIALQAENELKKEKEQEQVDKELIAAHRVLCSEFDQLLWKRLMKGETEEELREVVSFFKNQHQRSVLEEYDGGASYKNYMVYFRKNYNPVNDLLEGIEFEGPLLSLW